MQLKDQSETVVLNAPPSFEPELARLRGVNIRRSTKGVPHIRFALAFVTRNADVEALAKSLLPRLPGDAALSCAYPKGRSKKY